MARPDNPYNQKSYPVLGAGIFLTGIIILSIGLILGFEFPKYILRQGQLRVCITSPSSRGFEPWLYNRNRTKRNFVYIWNMTNAALFVHNGTMPQFRVIGPYIYDEQEIKVHVGFKYGQVNYRPWTRQFFNGPLTHAHCETCIEDDKVMTINPAFLQMVNVFPNELAYYVSLVPRFLTKNNRRNVQFDFDRWISRGDARYKRTLLEDRRRGLQSLSTYMHLYETLGDVNIFKSLVLRQPEVQISCDTRVIIDSDDLNQNDTVSNETNNDRLMVHSQECGLAYSLMRLTGSRLTRITNLNRLIVIMSSLMCRQRQNIDGFNVSSSNDESLRCFIENASDNLKRAYIEALVTYITEYLPSVLRTLVPIDITQLVSELSVGDYISGYKANLFNFRKVPHHMDNVQIGGLFDDDRLSRVNGILDHQDTEELAKRYSRRITLKTCLFNRSQTENLYYDEVDEFRSCNHQERRQEELSCDNSGWIGGVQDYEIPPTRTLNPCHQPEAFSKQVQFYIPEMWRSAIYSDSGGTVHEDVRVRDFRLNDDQGLNLTSTSHFTGHLSWVEMTDDVMKKPGTSAAVAKSNRILIEPISGYIWSRKANFRFYMGLKWQFPSVILNQSHFDVPIESHAIHIEIEPSDGSLRFYNSEVKGLLRASCVGLIGLTIVGLLVVALGVCVALALIRRPSNRVAPQFYVNPHLPPMDTADEGFGGNTVIMY